MARRGDSGAQGDASAYDLYGRERELGVLAALIDGAGADAGGPLVIRGEPGIGKSALLAAATTRARADRFRVLSAVGVQSEARLPFAGLHQLLRPVLHLAERLPGRQRAALLAAFGMSDQAAPELFLIGLATLELIGDAADGSPVLMIADDAHWLDEPSCAVLAFVARRLTAEPAALLIAVRDGLASPFDEADLPELRLEGLDGAAAAVLLDSRAPGLEPRLRERLIAEAAGNPLALVELPEAVRSEHLAGGAPVPADADSAEATLRAAEAALLPMGANPLLALVQFARGRGAVAQQRYAEAFADLRRVLDPADHAYHPFVGTWGLADLIEAAVNIGRHDAAAAYLSELQSLAATTSGPLLQAGAAYGRPLVAGDDTAEEEHQAALERDLANWPGYRSRMLLW